jgi:arylsulfatase A-like enzyme/Tfp pilus assembly protein PilF
MLRRSLSLRLFGILICVLLCVCSWAANQPNIILVTLDSTRADRMGFLGSKHATPNLDALAKQSVVFERTYAQAPLTVVSHATILSGAYPQTHHASELGAPLATALPYLPELLHARGYRTAAFVGSILLDPRNGFAHGFDRGFDTYDAGFHHAERGEDRYQSVERPADQVVSRAIKWISGSARGPFFLWVHLLWVHLNDPHVSDGISYDRAVAAADAALGKLVAALHTQKLYEGSIIVVAADHGESLSAHGEDTHGIFLYDETIHVPLLVKLPQNAMAGKRVKGRVRLLDVAPSVLEAAGIPVPSQMQGQSLLRMAKANADADQPVYARSDFPQQAFGWSALESWRAGKYLYIRAPKPELYDLSADPNATHNLAQSSKATLETMAAQLNAFDSRFGSEAGKPGETRLTSSEMQKLASLGYVGLQKPASTVNAAAEGTDPKDTIAIANQTLNALITLGEGKPEKAISGFRQALAAQANCFLAQYGLGVALAQQQQYSEAIEHLHKAIELQPDSAWAHYEMGLSLMKTGDFKTSAVHLEIASSRMREFAGLHSMLAQVYEHLARKEDANRERSKASQLGRN